jgi:endonuclease YncB( thermonuclease family)
MRKFLKIVPFLISFLLILPFLSAAGEFKVTRFYDGDTIKAKGHDIEIKVRLVGIDAPETWRKKRDPG